MKNVNFKYACLNDFKPNIVKPQYNKIVKNNKQLSKSHNPKTSFEFPK